MRKIAAITLVVAVFTGVGLWTVAIRGCWRATPMQSEHQPTPTDADNGSP